MVSAHAHPAGTHQGIASSQAAIAMAATQNMANRKAALRARSSRMRGSCRLNVPLPISAESTDGFAIQGQPAKAAHLHAARLVRQERFDGRPFVIGEFVAHDSK